MDIRISNIENYMNMFLNKNNNFNTIQWVDPIFVVMTRAYQSNENLPLYINNDYFKKMLTSNFERFKTFSPVENISNRIDVEKVADHLVSIMLKNFTHIEDRDIKDLRDYIQYMFSEIMNNVADHSHSVVGGYAMAQYYPQLKKIQFAVSDCGVGFLENIKLKFPHINSEEDAIKKALEKGVTATRATMYGSQKNAGYGLYAMQEILKLTSGRFCIISNDTILKCDNGSISSVKLLNPWAGTVIAFEFLESNINHNMDYFKRNFLWNDLDDEEDEF